jgi:zinc transporter ZupT
VVAVPIAALIIDHVRLQVAPWRDPQHLLSGLKSGVLLGTAFFVLLAQALSGRTGVTDRETVLSLFGLGFILALLVERSGLFFDPRRGPGLTSVLTGIRQSAAGVAIGAVSQTSLKSGVLVAVALLLQKSSSTAEHQPAAARRWTARLAAAILPLAALLTLTALASISPRNLSIILSLTAGAGVYVSASLLIPESHHTHSQVPTLSMTVVGSMIIYGLAHLT